MFLEILTEKYFKEYKENNNKTLNKFFKNSKNKNEKNNFNFYFESSAVYSSNIEGNPMDLNSFMNAKMLKNRKKDKNFEEINDLIKAYEFAKSNILTENTILEAHKIISKRLLIKNKRGKYREERIGVFGEEGLIYVALEPEKVKKTMRLFFKDISFLLKKKKLSTEKIFYFASMIHLKFAQIHPLADGNGRAARLLEKWFLASFIKEKAWTIKSEKYYKENRSEYYRRINLGDNFYEVNMNKCLPFLNMLPEAVIL